MRTPACVLMVGLILVAGPAVAACGKKEEGPTVVQAEQTLKSHVDQLLKDAIVENVRVSDSGGKDIPCGHRRAERTYAVTADKKDSPALSPVELSRRVLGSVDNLGGYKTTYLKGGDPVTKLHNGTARTNLTLRVPAKGKVEIYGSTDCLHT
ncbi:hypothetical protein GCM10009780_31080 [Actinomadura alba]